MAVWATLFQNIMQINEIRIIAILSLINDESLGDFAVCIGVSIMMVVSERKFQSQNNEKFVR